MSDVTYCTYVLCEAEAPTLAFRLVPGGGTHARTSEVRRRAEAPTPPTHCAR